jgi:hypothetical protein
MVALSSLERLAGLAHEVIASLWGNIVVSSGSLSSFTMREISIYFLKTRSGSDVEIVEGLALLLAPQRRPLPKMRYKENFD